MNSWSSTYKRLRNISTPSEMTLFKAMLIVCALKLAYQSTMDMELLPYSVRTVCNIGSLGIGLFAILNYISKNILCSIHRIFLVVMSYMFIWGLALSDFYIENNDVGAMFHTEYGWLMLFVAGSLFAIKHNTMVLFHNVMRFVGIASVVLGFYAFKNFTMDLSDIAIRQTTWTLSYMLWFASCSCVTYWFFYSVICKKDRLLGLAVVLTYFVLGMMFLKRAALINTMLFVVFAAVFSNPQKRIRNFVYVITGAIILVIALYFFFPEYFSTIQEALFGRFEETSSDMANFDRKVEWDNLVKDSETIQLITGYGIGNYAVRHGMGWLFSTHIGFYNLIYKGGVIYVLFYVVLYYKIISNFLRTKHASPLHRACFCMSIAYLLSMAYEASWGLTFQPFCISAPLFYAAIKHEDGNEYIA